MVHKIRVDGVWVSYRKRSKPKDRKDKPAEVEAGKVETVVELRVCNPLTGRIKRDAPADVCPECGTYKGHLKGCSHQ
jgi:hypothetical protein